MSKCYWAMALGALWMFSAPVEAGNYVSCQSYPGGTVTIEGQSYPQANIIECSIIDDGIWGFDGGEIEPGVGGGGSYDPYCDHLRSTKPSNCPNAVGMPSGANYGQYTYANGSGVAKLIYLKDSGLMLPAASNIVNEALSRHTADIASRLLGYDAINANLLTSLRSACQFQTDHALYGADGTRKCGEAFSRLGQESGNGTFFDWFSNWLQLNNLNVGLGITSLQDLISAAAPENSLGRKYQAVTEHAQCSQWWGEVAASGCGG